MEARMSDAPELLTVEEVCAYLKKDRSTLYRWEKSGLLVPFRPAPRTIYYTKQQLFDFLHPHPEPAIAPRTTRKKKR